MPAIAGGDACRSRPAGALTEMPIAEARSGLPLTDAQRQAERRIHDAPRDQEQDEQHDQAIDVAGVAEHIEAEQAEHRLDRDALQAVGAAGELPSWLASLAQHQRDAERHHQPRQVGAAQHQEAGDEAERRRGDGRRRAAPAPAR